MMESATTTTSIALARERSLAARRARLHRADQAADHLAAAADHGGDDDRRRPRRSRRSRPCSGRCSAATWPPAAPGRSTTTSTATATRAWRAPAGGRSSPGRIEPLHGLVFGIALGALATVQLALTVNALAAALALAGLLGYVFVYTIWLKPLTPQNIVIGGAAGRGPAAGRLGRGDRRPRARGAVAVRDRLPLDAAPLLGALAADQGRLRAHRRADAPRGQGRGRHPAPDPRLRASILVAFTLAPVATGFFGAVYGVAALVLGAGFVGLAVRLLRQPRPRRRAAALPVLARLPGAALLRDGRRRACSDKKPA